MSKGAVHTIFLTQDKSQFGWLCLFVIRPRHLTLFATLDFVRHVLYLGFWAQKRPLIRNFIVSGNGMVFLGILRKGAAIAICYLFFSCHGPWPRRGTKYKSYTVLYITDLGRWWKWACYGCCLTEKDQSMRSEIQLIYWECLCLALPGRIFSLLVFLDRFSRFSWKTQKSTVRMPYSSAS